MSNNVQFEDNRVRVINALNEGILNFLEEASGEIEAQAKRNTRVETSQTKERGRTVLTMRNSKRSWEIHLKMQFGKNSERVNMRFTVTVEKAVGNIKIFMENGISRAEKRRHGHCKEQLIRKNQLSVVF